MTERFLTVAELADRLHVSRATVYALVAARAIASYRVRHNIRFKQADVDVYEQAQRREADIKQARVAPRPNALAHAEECAALGIPPDHQFS